MSRRSIPHHRLSRPLDCLGALVLFLAASSNLGAFGFFAGNGLNGGARWDTEPRMVGAVERSIDGGLRFSVTGGSYEAFRSSFQWVGPPPTVEEFRQAVLEAFGAWEAVDPETGLTTDLVFVEDLSVAVTEGNPTTGAEIDVMADDFGHSTLSGVANVNWLGATDLLLTSGARIEALPISGADIRLNSNPGARWNLDRFRALLAHEIGHAIGLTDVDLAAGPSGRYVDDNFDGTTSATAAATLTNSFALLIDPLNPPASPLSLFTVRDADPGFNSPGVLVFMESRFSSSLDTGLMPLTNDDYAGRQFLYPSLVRVPVPEQDFYSTLEGVPLDVPNSAVEVSPVRWLPERSDWRYLDDGSNQGTAWRASDFDDSGWKTGRGKFGYGDNDEQTTILYGPNPNNNQNNPSQKFITTYFRTTFEASDILSTGALRLRILYDDGIAVYLNGTEVLRVNLPENAGHQTVAGTFAGGGVEGAYHTFVIPAPELRHGVNTLAVEIHQNDPTSSDLGFDMSLDRLGPDGGVLANDRNPEGAPPLDAAIEQQAGHGEVTLQSDGAFLYLPDSDFSGEDRFIYSVALPDGSRSEQTAVVAVFAPEVLGDADSDGDRFTDVHEAMAGTDPGDPNDFLRIALFARLSDRARIAWQGATHRAYWVDHSEDLANWSPIHAAPVPAELIGLTEFEDTDDARLSERTGAYRIRLAEEAE